MPVVDQAPSPAGGVRARVRAELTKEIKALARAQLETDGAAQLSLRAIARDLGMSSSAIYRYFASRDELLTALIIDAYVALGDHVEGADADHERLDRSARFGAVCRAIRRWALDHRHEYALIYGSPVPGYDAPDDTIDPAGRVALILLTPIVEHHADRLEAGVEIDRGPERLAIGVAGLSGFVGNIVPPSVLGRAVEAWSQLFGLISLELFGHFENTVTDTERFFDHAVDAMTGRLFDA